MFILMNQLGGKHSGFGKEEGKKFHPGDVSYNILAKGVVDW